MVCSSKNHACFLRNGKDEVCNHKWPESGVLRGNELKTRIDNIGSGNSGAAIDDTAPAADKAYSSQKVDSLIDAAKTAVKSEILDGADAAYDTLAEVAKYIEQDKTGATALSEAVAKRLRIDESQVLTQAQKTAVETTLNLGDTDTDFVAKLNQALQS